MASKWYLRVVREDENADNVNPTVVEFNPKDFRDTLITEYLIAWDVGRAFDRTCDRLRNLTRTL